jgi:phosphatidylglycerol---prolipoprotein diacylglyceryl transferase
VTAPLIPYVEVPELPLAFLTRLHVFDPHHPPSIKPFGTLVAFGVYLGSVIAMRHGRERGIEDKKLSEFIFFVIGMGFVGGHMLDAIFYHPHTLAADPLYLFALWDGLSSYGGFTGSALAALAWRCVTVTWKPVELPLGERRVHLFSVPVRLAFTWRDGRRVLPMVEVINSAFPLAWVFGRMGCSSVHDHPGRLSDLWFALRWPVPGSAVVTHAFGPLTFVEHLGPFEGRFDLGFIEMVLTIPLAVAFLVLWRRKPVRPLGFYTGWMCVAYAPVRFFLDFLRVTEGKGALNGGDPRYGGLTPAQWACFGLFVMGLWFVRMSRRGEKDGPTPPAGEPSAAPSEAGGGEG